MTDWESDINRHAIELVRLTLNAAGAGAPLPEDDLARLGMLIATERQLLIDAVTGMLREDDPEAAERLGIAEFDAGFRYGLAFARAIDDAKLEIERSRRGQVLKLVHRKD
jgi:hypothetical protein